jgi:hypothetical protein
MSAALSKTAKDAMVGKESVLKVDHQRLHGSIPLSSLLFNKKCQTPLLNRVYRNRMIGLERLKSAAITSFEYLSTSSSSFSSSSRQTGSLIQFVVLGAGYDISIDTKKYKTFYLDSPEVIQERTRMCAEHDQSAVLIPCDLRNTTLVLTELTHHGCDFMAPTVILCESILAYLDKESLQNLLRKFSREMVRCCVLVYDALLTPPFGSTLKKTFESRQVPLLSAMSSPLEMTVFLQGSCSFHHTVSLTIQQFLHCTTRTPITRSPDVVPPHPSSDGFEEGQEGEEEPFDEYAEIAALNRLYALTFSTNSRELFDEMNETLFLWSERNRTTAAAAINSAMEEVIERRQRERWNLLRCEVLRVRLLSYAMTFHPSTLPASPPPSPPLLPPSVPQPQHRLEKTRGGETSSRATASKQQSKRTEDSHQLELSRALLSPDQRRSNT